MKVRWLSWPPARPRIPWVATVKPSAMSSLVWKRAKAQSNWRSDWELRSVLTRSFICTCPVSCILWNNMQGKKPWLTEISPLLFPQLDPSIYESLQKERVEVGDVIYIEANSGAVKVSLCCCHMLIPQSVGLSILWTYGSLKAYDALLWKTMNLVEDDRCIAGEPGMCRVQFTKKILWIRAVNSAPHSCRQLQIKVQFSSNCTAVAQLLLLPRSSDISILSQPLVSPPDVQGTLVRNIFPKCQKSIRVRINWRVTAKQEQQEMGT